MDKLSDPLSTAQDTTMDTFLDIPLSASDAVQKNFRYVTVLIRRSLVIPLPITLTEKYPNQCVWSKRRILNLMDNTWRMSWDVENVWFYLDYNVFSKFKFILD